MRTTENKQLMRDIFAEFAQGQSARFVDSMADDFSWTMLGTTAWSGTYGGKRAVLEVLLPALRAKMEGRIKTKAHRFHADGDYVVVEASGDNLTKAGKPYNNDYCFVFRLSDGRLRTVTEYFDSELVTAALGDPGS